MRSPLHGQQRLQSRWNEAYDGFGNLLFVLLVFHAQENHEDANQSQHKTEGGKLKQQMKAERCCLKRLGRYPVRSTILG